MTDRDEIYASISAQLRALRAGPRSRWRKFRALELVCGRCGELLAEVMATHPESVLLARLPVLSEPDEDQVSTHRVADEVMMISLAGTADEDVTTVGCKCRTEMLGFLEVRELLAAGTRRHVVPFEV